MKKSLEEGNKKHIDCFDELSKQLNQTHSMINTILSADHFINMQSEDLANVLWNISDSLDRAKEASSELYRQFN